MNVTVSFLFTYTKKFYTLKASHFTKLLILLLVLKLGTVFDIKKWKGWLSSMVFLTFYVISATKHSKRDHKVKAGAWYAKMHTWGCVYFATVLGKR